MILLGKAVYLFFDLVQLLFKLKVPTIIISALIFLYMQRLIGCIVSVNKHFYDAMSNVTLQFICSFI